MGKKIKMKKVSRISIVVSIVLIVICIVLFGYGRQKFADLKRANEQYVVCENAASQLQEGSIYLTQQARLFVENEDEQYMTNYFQEVHQTKRREKALESLIQQDINVDDLTSALNESNTLLKTEEYAMRLIAEANNMELPEDLQKVQLSVHDTNLSKEEKIQKAKDLVFDQNYQDLAVKISKDVKHYMNRLIQNTYNQQNRAESVFADVYLKLEIIVAIFCILVVVIGFSVLQMILKPLLVFNEKVVHNELFPLIGVSELQTLARTYNKVYEENEETKKLIRHEAQHDGLTDLLNRKSFDKMLEIYASASSDFALILVDVDIFKSVNDTYGHAIGDEILKKVAHLLKTEFRSIDHVCRIGGDEFAVIMVDVNSPLGYTIQEKIDYINTCLANPTDGLPQVSLSVGVAFSDRKNPKGTIFSDADQALYKTKENGKCGCSFY